MDIQVNQYFIGTEQTLTVIANYVVIWIGSISSYFTPLELIWRQHANHQWGYSRTILRTDLAQTSNNIIFRLVINTRYQQRPFPCRNSWETWNLLLAIWQFTFDNYCDVMIWFVDTAYFGKLSLDILVIDLTVSLQKCQMCYLHF